MAQIFKTCFTAQRSSCPLQPPNTLQKVPRVHQTLRRYGEHWLTRQEPAPAGSGPRTTASTGKSCHFNPTNLPWHFSLDNLWKHVNAAKERTPQPLGTWTKARDPDYLVLRAKLFQDFKRGRKDKERVDKATGLRSEVVAVSDPCLLCLQMLEVCILMDHPSAFKGRSSACSGLSFWPALRLWEGLPVPFIPPAKPLHPDGSLAASRVL